MKRFSEEKSEESWNETALNCINSKEKKNEKYNGMTVPEVRAMWSAAGEYARTLGTEMHSVMENLWYRKDYNGNRALMSQYEGMEQDFDGCHHHLSVRLLPGCPGGGRRHGAGDHAVQCGLCAASGPGREKMSETQMAV